MSEEVRILTTHAGSLPRPAALTELFVRRTQDHPIDAAALAEAGRAAVGWVVGKQREAGLDIISNGEQQRESFVLYLRRRLSGIGGQGERAAFADIEAYPKFKAERARLLAHKPAVSNIAALPKCIGPISYIGEAELADECATFKAAYAAQGQGATGAFVTAASPGILASIVKNEHYLSFDAYLEAIAAALRVEYEAIVGAGFNLQIDAPDLALERHASFAARPLKDFQRFVERVIGAINGALVNIAPAKVRLHVCWGNYEGPHDCDVPLADILPILCQAQVGGLYLPFANPRHAHEYQVLKAQPLAEQQVLVAGVIDTVTNYVEHPEVVADRLERIAAASGDPERIMAGTDCGFDTSAGMGRVAEDVVWAKLRALVEGARLASRRLFG
ncbi:MAG TPA: cobalamin-independent methionine synthase II family protein [Hyphomicrobiaceae bacterium]|nr:cobalamin-independent methionine synthase II family protein [Hyphomicrobiaceae bacterium]